MKLFCAESPSESWESHSCFCKKERKGRADVREGQSVFGTVGNIQKGAEKTQFLNEILGL